MIEAASNNCRIMPVFYAQQFTSSLGCSSSIMMSANNWIGLDLVGAISNRASSVHAFMSVSSFNHVAHQSTHLHPTKLLWHVVWYGSDGI
jgi:hypothetical protein